MQQADEKIKGMTNDSGPEFRGKLVGLPHKH